MHLNSFYSFFGGMWYSKESKIAAQLISFLMKIENLSLFGASTAALIGIDFAIGKLIGIRPISLFFIAIADAYRQGAKNLSNHFKENYLNHEKKVQNKEIELREEIVEELVQTYKAMTLELLSMSKNQDPNILQEQLRSLDNTIQAIRKRLPEIGVSKTAITKILFPLKTAISQIQKRNKGVENLSKRYKGNYLKR